VPVKASNNVFTDKLFPELLPGSRAARRLPIGLEETIAHLQRDDFVAYLHHLVPSREGDYPGGRAMPRRRPLVEAITKNFAAWTRARRHPRIRALASNPTTLYSPRRD
jgi:hypothetical protein